MNAKVAVSAPRCAARWSWKLKLPFLVWYKTMFLMSCTKRDSPPTNWIEALRTGMGDGTQTPQGDGQPGCKVYTGRDDRTGWGLLLVASKEIERGKIFTRGRGAEEIRTLRWWPKAPVGRYQETGKRRSMCVISRPGYWIAIKVKGINGVVRDCMEDDAIVFFGQKHFLRWHLRSGGITSPKSDAKTTKETLKWVHIAISNAKRTLLGNYHKIKRKYLQLYLKRVYLQIKQTVFWRQNSLTD